MFKLVVLFALVAVAAARPGLVHGVHAIPAAVSHSARVDVVQHAALVAPAVHVAPAVVAHHIPAAVSHQSRVDVVHSAPIVHAVPVVQTIHGGHGHGLGLGLGGHW